MESARELESRSQVLAGGFINEGRIKVFSKTLTISTKDRTELVNLTDEIRQFVAAAGVSDGFVQISSLHTTAALFVNEWQDALLTDIRDLLDRVVPCESYYRHNDPEHSDCDRQNAHSHLRNLVLGHNLSVPIAEGNVVLGRWQSLIFAEFDGPNERKVFVQVLGL